MSSSPKITFFSQNPERHRELIDYLKNRMGQIQTACSLELQEKTDLILIEAIFPFSRIYKFLKRLQANQSTACIILMGPDLDASRVSAFLQAGVFDYLKIPFPLKCLRKTIHKGLKNRESLLKILDLSKELEIANKALSEERDQLKQWNNDLSQLYTLNQTLSASLHIDEVVQSFMKQIEKVASYDIAMLYLRRWSEVYFEADRSKWGSFIDQETEQTRQEGIQFIKTKQSIFRPIIRDEGREIRVPLQVGANKVGLLRLLHLPNVLAIAPTHSVSRNDTHPNNGFHADNHFSNYQLKLLSMIAPPLSIAIRNAEMYRQVEDLAVKDALTGVLNRRAFSSILEREFMRADRYRTPLALMVIDLDHFKDVNDNYGHLAGDQVLQEMALLFKKSLRDIDVLIRYGGEEFVVILPGTNLQKSLVVAKRIKDRVEAAVFYGEESIKMTVSIGLADTPGPEINSPEALFRQADQALYVAKEKGRNRIMAPARSESPWEMLAMEEKGAA